MRGRDYKEKPTANHSSDSFFKPRVQKKLSVGRPGDKFEKEADSVADKVVNKADSGDVQRAAMPGEEEKVQQKPLSQTISSVQKKELQEEEQPVQKAAEMKQEEQPVQKKEEEEQPVQAKEEEEQPVQKAAEMKEEEQPVQKKEEEEQPVQQKAEEQDENIQTKLTGAPTTKNTPKKAESGVSSIESKLATSKGKGNPMQGGVKSEMESGFGTAFNDVRIHTDTQAEQMSSEMGALAFTHGKDIYFNSGQYDPNSAEGKTLLAHELTHTIQQEGAKDLDNSANDSNLESDANASTRGFVGRMMGGIANAGKAIMPKLKSGLRIARCEPSARDKALAEFKKKRAAGSSSIPPAQPGIKTAAVALGQDTKVMDSYHRFQEKEKAGGDLVWGFFFSKDKSLTSATKKPGKFDNWKDYNSFSGLQKSTLFQISRITGEVIHTRFSQNDKNLQLLKKAYDYWPSNQFAVHQSGSSEASNTCNVFVGNALFNAGFTGNNKGKFFSAAEVYKGANGTFAEIDKEFTQPGDIVAYGPHVGVVVTVDPESETFVTREGFITPKGRERIRNFDELLGLEKPELKIMRKK